MKALEAGSDEEPDDRDLGRGQREKTKRQLQSSDDDAYDETEKRQVAARKKTNNGTQVMKTLMENIKKASAVSSGNIAYYSTMCSV
jgi:uncharacterized protein with gpF-like domain